MLVKAVANATTASFIRVVGSEFVQKYLGEVSLWHCDRSVDEMSGGDGLS